MDAKRRTDRSRRRRWLTFSLRSLLIFTVIAGFGFGWLGMKVKEARDQRLAVEAIRAMGGEVRYDYEVDETGNRIKGAEPSVPRWLRTILGFHFFVNVIAAVSSFNSQVTDAGLIHLAGFTHLERLVLENAEITDTGLVHLSGLTNLNQLVLCQTQVTDAGLVHIKALTKLQTLYLDGTEVTDEGVAMLQQALPNCEIEY